MMVSGIIIGDGNLIVLGGFTVGIPSLLYVGVRIVETQNDEYLERQRSPAEPRGSGQGRGPYMEGVDGSVLQEGPGTCQACGGTLFYVRLNCPHCSESIFQGAGDEARPPEF